MSFGWHPREHRAALDGMLMLTLEERGAYNTLLDLIYERAGPIPDDPRWLAGWMGVSLQRWKKLRASLIVKAKIYATEVDGVASLMNERAAREIDNQAKRAQNLAESGAKGGRNSRKRSSASDPKSNENNDPDQATLKLKTKTGTELSVVPPNGETTGGEPPDPNARAWRDGSDLLVALGGMTATAARSFFGRLLKDHGLEARDLLSAIGQAYNQQTADPQGFLKAAAKARERKRSGPPKRVGFV